MASKFKHDEVFPIIAELIKSLSQSSGRFVTHNELVAAMLNDSSLNPFIDSAGTADAWKKSREWWASNMAQWFSQQFTQEVSPYHSQFERQKIDGDWAYRPVADGGHR